MSSDPGYRSLRSTAATSVPPGRAEWLDQTTVADVRNLIAATILTVHHSREHCLRWFAWHLTHKIRAQLSHYRRRGDPLPAHLLRWITSHTPARAARNSRGGRGEG